MLALFTCEAGHQWRADPAAPPSSCPECARPARRSADPAEAATGPHEADDKDTPDGPFPGEDPKVPGYEILGKLGKGGMGVVYRAWQQSLRRDVALKMMHREGLREERGEEAQARFRREAEAVASLDHPNIIQVHDFFEHAGLLYLTMELVEGTNLADQLAHGPLALEEAAPLVETLARAVHYAHEQRIVHRDLKPRNVLLARRRDHPDGEAYSPKVADFGLAKRLDQGTGLTLTGAIMGTASYMAPEQAEGSKDIGPGTDVWALGAILYETLTGQPPFRGETLFDIIEQVRTRDPVAPGHLRPGLPEELETVCLKCLEKDPRDRYPSADALAEDLARFRAGETLTIRPLSEWERQVRWARRAGYEIEELIGSTQVGMVYRARELNLPRQVALKTISLRAQMDRNRLRRAEDQEAWLAALGKVQDRFRAEAQAAAQLQHPHIQQVYHQGEYQGQSYLAMEYLDGGTLADRLTGHPFPPRQAAQLVETLAQATHHAHLRGIVHSDLRPFNILLRAPEAGPGGEEILGTAKITGFGLARLLEKRPGDTPSQGARRVFSSYMAPEQAGRPGPLGPPTDVHALGAILYKMLTGQPPFEADTVRETLAKIRDEVPSPPTELVPDLPPRLEAVCLRCLEKEPGRRFPTTLELAEELRRYLQQTEEFELIPGYEIGEEMGQGGLGQVFRARQTTRLLREVALKIYREQVAHILAANRAVARLDHPHIVRILDCGERDGLLYVAEELIEGGSLDGRLAGGPLPPEDAVRLAGTLARTLQYVHGQGITHLNLKPKAVLLTEQGEPKVTGFDLARLPDQEAEEDAVGLRGTPAYMAPEQAEGQVDRLGPATDIHGLGLVLYEMLTGRKAFEGPTLLETLQQVRQNDPVPPSQLQAEIPTVLEAICMKCLRKDPSQRYPTAAALAEELERCLRRSWHGLLRWLPFRPR